MTITSSTVSGNVTTVLHGDGAGINTNDGNVTLNNSTVSGNSGGLLGGGGVGPNGSAVGDVTLNNSTVSGNSNTYGGGIYAGGNVSLTNSTVTENSSSGGGGGIFVFNNSIHNYAFGVQNSIVAGNTASGTAPNLLPDPDSTLNISYSIIGDTTGFDRIVGGRIDIGAFEVGANSADFDQDGDVDSSDFLAWQRGFGTLVPNANKTDGDANNDTAVNGADLTVCKASLARRLARS